MKLKVVAYLEYHCIKQDALPFLCMNTEYTYTQFGLYVPLCVCWVTKVSKEFGMGRFGYTNVVKC